MLAKLSSARVVPVNPSIGGSSAYWFAAAAAGTATIAFTPVQKLFTTFPAGAPGAALLLLRSALAVALVLFVEAPLAMRLAAAVFLGLGLLTPLIAPMAAVLALVCVWLNQNSDPGLCALIAVHACALSMLGPGAYSLDSRLFGRRLVVWPPESK